MNELKASINLNAEINDSDLLMDLNVILAEHSMTLEQFILLSINKAIIDIKFMKDIKNSINKK